MGAYETRLRVLSSQVDPSRRMRVSTLFMLLQEAAIAHTTLLGMGREKTLDRGLLWAVTMQRSQIERLPVYDEEVKLASWPGATMHVLFPRYYQLTGADGKVLVRASALWVLMDRRERRFVFPEAWGIRIDAVTTGAELPLPKALKLGEPTGEGSFTVPYSYVDLNGHMNNTRYFDLAEDWMPPDLRLRPLREAAVEYCGEARLGTHIHLTHRREESSFSLSGETEGKRLFRLRLDYAL